MFIEAFPLKQDDQGVLRGNSMLRYLPIAVSQFEQGGTLMEQNPEACRVFGTPGEQDRDVDDNNTSTATTAKTTTTGETPTCSHQEDTSSSDATLSTEGTTTTINSGCSCSDDPASTPTSLNQSNSSIPSLGEDVNGSKRGAVVSKTSSQDPAILQDSSKRGDDATNSKDSSSKEVDDTSTKKKDRGGESQADDNGGGLSKEKDINNNNVNTTNHFLNLFVDRTVGLKIFNDVKAGKNVNVEALVKTKDGPQWNAIYARLARDALSSNPIILSSATDISEIVMAKKETQLNKERSEFFAIMAHEIRTPLFQVTGFIDLLHETQLNNEQKDCVKLLRASAASLMTVINDVLDYSKLEAGKMHLDIVPFEPRGVVEGALAAIAPRLEDKGLRFSSSFATGVPVRLMGDPNRLRQILLNLLNNAVKFTHKGKVDVSVGLIEKDKDGRAGLRFAVTDTGIGIDSKNLTDIFRQYNQAAPAIATAYGGTGLGLSICKSLVECMDGSMGVDSIVGEGSTFWFEIFFDRPKVDAKIFSVDEAKVEEVTSNLRILVAEDNGVSQKLISKMLVRLGHEATIVSNGEEAVKEVQRRVYDLVLMDIQMPVMDGLDATKEIRCLGMTIPIVGLSASVRREDFHSIGLTDWIGKPVRLKELQTKLNMFQ
jgi:signal transduction histidine kinase